MGTITRKTINVFLLAVGAGICIGIGGTVFLSIENKIVGAVMFTIALYAIMLNGLNLFTGKVCYCFDYNMSYVSRLAVIWLGNFTGTYIAAKLICLTRIVNIEAGAEALSAVKLNDSILSVFVLAIFCGILMYIAVNGFKEHGNPLIMFVCITCFILCGFEHCIANMFYFSMAGVWTAKSIAYILVMTLGNGVGGVMLPLIKHSAVNAS